MGTNRPTLDALPHSIVALSILPYLTSNDLLSTRVASRAFYETIHGTSDVYHSFCSVCENDKFSHHINRGDFNSSRSENEGNPESESFWRMALNRDFQFDREGAENRKFNCYDCIHSPFQKTNPSFLTTDDVFQAPTAFISWKHWRKIDCRLHSRRIRSNANHWESENILHENERIVGPFFLRASSLWKKIEQWCNNEAVSGELGPKIKSSLRPGEAIDPNSTPYNDGISNPNFLIDSKLSALKAVYAFYAGQRPPRQGMHSHGLFGGFSAYRFGSITYWKEPSFKQNSLELIIAFNSLHSSRKKVVMNLASGQVYVHNGITNIPATRTELPEWLVFDFVDGPPPGIWDASDSILKWFEEHANRLHCGYYSVGNLFGQIEFPAILQYPTARDTLRSSRAVTRGVEVVASSIFVQDVEMTGRGGLFIYSIRIRLLSSSDGEEYESSESRGFDTCQLVSRYWRISKQSPSGSNSEPVIEEVQGDGVVGEYPLLMEGGYRSYLSEGGAAMLRQSTSLDGFEMDRGDGCFVYQSCTDDQSFCMEGYLDFVPGSLVDPKGDLFRARVAPFRLNSDSDYLY